VLVAPRAERRVAALVVALRQPAVLLLGRAGELAVADARAGLHRQVHRRRRQVRVT
jgi:hypothetical protein